MMMASGGGAGKVESSSSPAAGVAPFVAKTYRMVDDPATDAVIAWGSGSNSFVVADPFAFSQTLLPAHFKHSNFSSFVRQLNTYGFRKVDSDRWEFAHVSFLRGQTHLLRHIVRRACSAGKRGKDDGAAAADDDDDAAVAMEVVRLRREQRAIEDQVAAMWRRVQETERRPKQMLAFLVKVAGDPQVLRRLVAGADGLASEPEEYAGQTKRPRLLLDGAAGAGVDDDFAAGYGGEGTYPIPNPQPPPPPPQYAFPVNSGY